MPEYSYKAPFFKATKQQLNGDEWKYCTDPVSVRWMSGVAGESKSQEDDDVHDNGSEWTCPFFFIFISPSRSTGHKKQTSFFPFFLFLFFSILSSFLSSHDAGVN